MSETAARLPLDSAATIATYLPSHDKESLKRIGVDQATHRINLVHAWDAIPAGARVLEIGCGQGDCTTVLAEAIGAGGTIDAVDPGSPDYGAPFTLGQAHAHIAKSPVGGRVTFHRADPLDYLAQTDETWDVAVLAHCIWYFKSAGSLSEILKALRGRVKTVLVAEYALHASERAAQPHVLAALARATLEAHFPDSSQNIVTPLSPAAVKVLAQHAKWAVKEEKTVVPDKALQDGKWEVGAVVADEFLHEIEESGCDQRVGTVLFSAREAVIAAVADVGGMQNVQTMDVWVGVLE